MGAQMRGKAVPARMTWIGNRLSRPEALHGGTSTFPVQSRDFVLRKCARLSDSARFGSEN